MATVQARRRGARPKLGRAAAAVVAALAMPACAFWELNDDLSARAGQAPDAEAGASPEGSPGARYCEGVADGSLFCDDFEGEDVVWTDRVVCKSCTATLTSEVPSPPSPARVLLTESRSGETNASSYFEQTILGTFDAVRAEFSAYVERADANGQAAIQELAFEVDDNNRIRVRIWVSGETLRLGTAVTSTELPNVVFDDFASAPFAQKTWHRVAYTLSNRSRPAHVSWTVDGVPVVYQRAIREGDRIRAKASRVLLRNGVFYIGVPPDTGGTRLSTDNVLLGIP